LEYSDLVRQKWLDNHFYGLNFNLENQRLGNLKFFTGISASQYKNSHFGEVIWVKDFENPNTDVEFYRNKSQKTDVSVYAKALLSLNKFELFGDLQYRFVNYKGLPVAGGENEFEDFFPFEGNFNFLNPKVGLNFYASQQDVLYFYYGMAHREPHRGDYLENSEIPRPEKLHDFEFGYKKSGRLNLTANGFFMYYIDQLVDTGELNDVGEYKRTNSGESYRTGIELSANYDIIPRKLNVYGNLTYSINRNIDYSEIAYDADWNEILIEYGETDI